jgi:CBS domain-containing protein
MNVEIPSTVSEIMSRDVLSVEEDDTLLNLLASLKALRFRHLPVVDESRLIGLVTLTDLLGIASSNLLPHHGEQDRQLQERLRVRDIMAKDVVTVSPDTSLQEAGVLLLKQRVGCLPVVDGTNVVVGIVTASDFVKVVAQRRAPRSPPASGEPKQVQ